MSQPPNLLNDDDSASMATLLMTSHHGFRRDVGMFAVVLARPSTPAMADLGAEWMSLHGKLHGHHHEEDQNVFPSVQKQKPDLMPVIERLIGDHRRIDPLLTKGDAAFAARDVRAAAAVVAELSGLLDAHLAVEEQEVVPLLRVVKGFPAPSSEAEADLYAQGFAWSSLGVAPDVLARIDDLLPESLRQRLPAARAAFAHGFLRLWGPVVIGASRTPVPDWLPTT